MRELVRYDAARRALADAATIDEVAQINDQAEALRHYARQRKDADMEAWCAEIKLRAIRRIGELSKELDSAQTDRERDPVTGRITSRPTDGTSGKRATLKEAGISASVAHRCEQVADILEQRFEELIAKARQDNRPITVGQVLKRGTKKEDQARKNAALIQRAAAFPDKKYHILLADPPWRYENPAINDPGRAVENHYPTMTVADIAALVDVDGRPVIDLSAPDALLYLWTTAPKLADSLGVVEAWGFDYRTCLVWVKDKIGTGYHARAQHELVLIGRRGQIPPPAPELRVSSVIFAERGRHSAKPPELHERIERAYPDLAKVELFCRSPRPGWDTWGYEASDAA